MASKSDHRDSREVTISSGTESIGNRPAEDAQSLPPVLVSFLRFYLGLTLLTVAWCAAMHFIVHKSYPYDWPFFFPAARFTDFTIYQKKFALFHHAAFFHTGFPFTYPAPMALLYELFFRVGGTHALRLFLAFLLLAFVVPAALFARALVQRGLRAGAAVGFCAALLLLSWPFLLMLDRANVEVFVWVTLALGAWAYAKGRNWLAATMFGMAAALKLFPFILLALLLTRSKLPKLLWGAVVFAGVTVASLAILGPNIEMANQGIKAGLAYFHDAYIIQYLVNEMGFDHSLLAFLKSAAFAVLRSHADPVIHVMSNADMPVMAALGTVLYLLVIRKLPWTNQLIVLSGAAIFFTPFSGDGTLVHLYPGFALCCFLALDAQRRGVEIPGLRVLMLCFAYLFAVEGFWVYHYYRFQGQMKCLALAILLVTAMRYPFGPPVADVTEDLSWMDAERIPDARPV